MRIAIDTNWYRDFMSGEADAVDQLRAAEQIYLPFVTLAELRSGFIHGTRSRENEVMLTRFLETPRVETLHSTDRTTRFYAQLYSQLRMAGSPIPTNDLWIAALVVENDLYLCTRDAHFDRLPQLPRL